MTEFEQLAREHGVLLRQHARAQSLCSRDLAGQSTELLRAQAEVMRLRAAVIVRDSIIAFTREDKAQLEATIPGLPRRLALAQRVESLVTRVQALTREVLHWQWRASTRRRSEPASTPRRADPASVLCIVESPYAAPERRTTDLVPSDESRNASPQQLEASLAAADLVICQVGCLSSNAYWRVEDHCRRTGKPCVLVDEQQVISVAIERLVTDLR
jgi:hypothetical protein